MQLSTDLNATSVDDVVKSVGAATVSAATLKTSWLASYNASLVTALQGNKPSAVASAATSPVTTSFILLLPVTVVAIISVL